jgi:cell fate regulator YaaT (PSP1 superfamily)
MAQTVVGVRFKQAGKKYYFSPGPYDLATHDKVVVETVRGIELGEIIEDKKTVEDDKIISSLKPVLRKASEKDLKDHQENLDSIPEDLRSIAHHIRNNRLDMKLLGAEYTLDRSKLIIYFTAEGRVDFRELVKDLATEFRLRIELRQVGTRDGAKFLGGIGPCGYLLCCNTWLGDFDTVSIRMAKNQNLSLNPANISGLCGKLMCCIKYENDTYTEHRRELPKVGSFVTTKEHGRSRVLSLNIIDKKVRVLTEQDGVKTFPVEELTKIEEYDKKPKQRSDGE